MTVPSAGALHCPNCGASASPTDRRCPYCRARLATVSCGSCFGLMFDGAAYCPHCGARRQRTVADGEAGACPGCGQTLRQVMLGSTAMLECESCDAVWMDADAFERLCADREAQAAVVHRERPQRPKAARPAIHYRPCLRCGKLMNRINFGKASGVIVDTCRGHGTFLDAGELHRIVAFIQGGGLDRMRERQREALVEEQRRLEVLQQQQAVSFGGDTEVFRWTGPSLQRLLTAIKRRV